MICHLLKQLVSIAKLCPDKSKVERVDELWLQAEGLLTEARKELNKATPYLRQRAGNPDTAYLAVLKAKGILKELDENT